MYSKFIFKLIMASVGFLLGSILMISAGCGQSGPLTMPEKTTIGNC